MRGREDDIEKIGLVKLPVPPEQQTDRGQIELLEDSQSNLKTATSGAMSSLQKSQELLVSKMNATIDPKALVELANALAGTVQTQVNVIKLGKEIFKK